MINFNQSQSFNICDYILSLVRYTLFSDEKQSNECEILQTEGGFLFVPVYPVSYVIDETFYNRLFDILNLGLTPMYTCVRPLTMQVVTLADRPPNASRALFIPAHKGKPKRLKGTVQQLGQSAMQTGKVPIMDIIAWNYVKSPHAIITGVSGSGKSYFLKYLYGVCAMVGDVIAIDPKCSDLARLAKKSGNNNVVIPKFDAKGGIGGEYLESVLDVMRKVEHEMYQRQNALFSKTQRVSTDYREISARPIFLFIDELAALMTSADKAKKTSFQDLLTCLVVLGREAGIYLVLSMQSARAEYVPTIVRDSISLRVQLGRINSENSRFLFPELSEMPFVPIGGNGSGILSIAGDPDYAGIEPVLTPTILD